MKKFLYTGIFAIALIVSANANAAVNNNTLNYNEGDSSNFYQVERFKCVDSKTVYGYDAEGNELCNGARELVAIDADIIFDRTGNNDVVVGDDDGDTGTTTPTTPTGTVSSCPSGTTKSSDGCCCIMD